MVSERGAFIGMRRNETKKAGDGGTGETGDGETGEVPVTAEEMDDRAEADRSGGKRKKACRRGRTYRCFFGTDIAAFFRFKTG
jgi:hypothetical protein